jgi:ankyrin repeat protein
VAELLLVFRANVNVETNDGWTPLHAAVVYGYGDVATLLRGNGGHE